ncbi:MAG: PAS domain S-box protein [Pseudomonadota bacterium]
MTTEHSTATGISARLNEGLADEVIQTVNTPIVVLSSAGDILRFNAASEELTGYSTDEVLGQKIWHFLILDEEIASVRSVFERTIDKGAPTHFTNHWKTKTGERRLLEWSNKTIHNRDGAITGILATGLDITDSKAREKQLSQTRSYLQSIIDASPVAIITTNIRGEILSVSREAEHCFLCTENQVINSNINEMIPGFTDFLYNNGGKNGSKKSSTNETINRTQPVVAKRLNGESFPATIHISEFINGERILVGFIEDKTQHQALERRLEDTQLQLQHAGRISAMGEIASTIAHELNQPLTAAASLAGAVSLILKKGECGACKDATALLDDAVGEIRRGSEIIRQMRDFLRMRKTAKSLHDLNQVIEEACVIALIGAQSEGVNVDMNLADDIGMAPLDRIQMQQVIVNLVRNAIDAMHGVNEKTLTISTQKTEDSIEICVEDTGHGVSEDINKRLFEPFVTSKEEGMGIGLSLSKSIIDAHQGEITAKNKESGGCVFTVKLPVGVYANGNSNP